MKITRFVLHLLRVAGVVFIVGGLTINIAALASMDKQADSKLAE
jgi:hypothetical protein